MDWLSRNLCSLVHEYLQVVCCRSPIGTETR